MIFALDVGAPRLTMNAQPCVTLGLPLRAQVVRQSVGKSKRNEINRAFLLPMWQAVRSETNLPVRIEKPQCGHGRVSVSDAA